MMLGNLKLVPLAALSVTALLSLMPTHSSSAGEPPLDLKWSALVPKGKAPAAPNKTFFSGSQAQTDDAAPPPPPLPEGQFMSMKRRQPGGDSPPQVVAELDGKRVKIGGYIVPLDFEATRVKEFLLVPFVGACIHVPPPPANQIIYVKSESGIEIAGSFDPVSVTGLMKTETAFTGLADAGYSIEAETVETITP